jgi:hypothetical protein
MSGTRVSTRQKTKRQIFTIPGPYENKKSTRKKKEININDYRKMRMEDIENDFIKDIYLIQLKKIKKEHVDMDKLHNYMVYVPFEPLKNPWLKEYNTPSPGELLTGNIKFERHKKLPPIRGGKTKKRR